MIGLIHNSGFSWNSENGISTKGCFFDKDSKLYTEKEMLTYFQEAKQFDDFVNLLIKANGIFSVIIEKEDEIWIASDRSRTFPVLYSLQNNNLIISDDSDFIQKEKSNFTIDKLEKEYYLATGFTSNDNTLFNEIKQTQCAEAICFRNNKISNQQFYHSFSTDKFLENNYNELKELAFEKIEESFKRLISSLDNRTAVVPLSGGYDSRLIAAMLKKHNYKNVICFTYGRKENNSELIISEKVAQKLGYRWIFVEYNKELFDDYAMSDEFKSYISYMSHLGSMFYLQEYFAVKYLKDNQLIPENSIFIPGHSGDLLGGSQLVKTIPLNLKQRNISKKYIKAKFIYNKPSKNLCKYSKERIDNHIKNNHNKPTCIFEEIDIREKISKVIFNSSMVFDFFGYEKRFPLWDKAMLNFFLRLPSEVRINKQLYDYILINKVFEPLEISFSKELQPDICKIKLQKIKNIIKDIFPIPVQIYFSKKHDWINYQEATIPLLKELKESKEFKKSFNGKFYNEILIKYYILFLKNRLKI